MLRGVGQAHPGTVDHNVHRNAGLGTWVLINENWYKPYSPDFNPIEMAFSKLKAFLKKVAARTIDELWAAIAVGIDAFTPTECLNYFAAAGYDCE
jgi:transposase